MDQTLQTFRIQQSSVDVQSAEVALEASSLPEISLQEELKALLTTVNDWFKDLPSVAVEQTGNEIIHWSRRHHFEVQHTHLKLTADFDEATVPVEIIYFPTSAEIWVSRFQFPGQTDHTFMIDSWYGMHHPSFSIINSEGVIDPKRSTGDVSGDEAIELLYKCQDSLDLRQLDSAIGGIPKFKNTVLNDELCADKPIVYEAFPYIKNIPLYVARASIQEESTVDLGTVFPFNRKDLVFFDSQGTFQPGVLAEAVPTIARLYRLLDAHGYEPTIKLTALDLGDERDASENVPGFTLLIDTKAALKHIEIVPADTVSKPA